MVLINLKNIINKQILAPAERVAERVAFALIIWFNLDSQRLHFQSTGVLKYRDHESGEKWFIDKVLTQVLSDIEEPVILDIGANFGEYSLAISSALPTCRCYALEPNPITFEKLKLHTKHKPNIVPLNYGAGLKKEHAKLFVYKSDSSTSHASIYRDVFRECHMQNDSEIAEILCNIDKIDSLIESQIVPEKKIHFIKIDTEGHELQGLKGALSAIKLRGVRAVQFEFNEMNVVSRVFLKDFYELLGEDWCFFRLDTRRLITLGSRYDSANEIFKFQNIIAIRKSFLPFEF